MYRVRYSWDKADSQLGAYNYLQKAIEKANAYYEFGVFDESGKLVHKSTCTLKVPYRVRPKWSDEAGQLGAYDYYQNAVQKANEVGAVSVYDYTGKCIYTAPIAVKTMSYKVKLKKAVGSHKKGEKVIVNRNMAKQWIMSDGTIIKNKTYMDLLTQIYDPNCIYSQAAAQAWVNQNGFESATNYLYWCNKYGQRAYIFTGSKGHWTLVKTYKCGTGNISYGDGSDQGIGFKWKIWDKKKVFDGPHGKQYWNMHYTSAWGNSIHKGSTGKPVTHGCIAMGKEGIQWVFNNVPINTRVIVY